MNAPDSAAMETSSNTRRWWIVNMLACFAFVSYFQRTNISVAAELMMPSLGLSKIQMGQIFSSFLIGYAIFQIPGGIIGDKVGPKLTLGFSVLIWGVTTALTGLAGSLASKLSFTTFLTLGIIRFLLGAAEATTYPVGSRAVFNWFPAGERALGNSLMMTGTSVGAAVSTPVVSWLMLRLGWQDSFFATSLPAFLVALIWFSFAADRPVSSCANLHQIGVEIIDAKPELSLRRILTSRRVILLCLSYVSEGYVLFLFVFWLYIYLVEIRGFNMLKGGVIAALPWVTGFIFTPIGGFASDKISARAGRLAGAKYVVITGYSLSGLLLFIAAYSSSRGISIGALCLSVGFLMGAEAPFWACASSFSGNHAATVSGVMNTAGIMGGVVSTSLIPVLVSRFGWLTALSSGAVMAFCCCVVWLAIGAERSSEIA